MASYFDITTDKYLLHASVRNHAEASNVATKAERDLIRLYTYRNNSGTLTVGIKGYAADADDVTQTGLVQAMKDAIAAVITARLRNYDSPKGVTSESLGDYSVTLSGASEGFDAIPEEAEFYLADFDIRTAVFW